MAVAIVAAWALALLAPAFASAQDAPEEWLERLERVMPEADRFTDRQGQPPVFEAYRIDSSTGQETLAGYAFLTSDLPPEQRGFNGPIEVLVGIDLRGVLTGIVVARYRESLQSVRGDFLATDGIPGAVRREEYCGRVPGSPGCGWHHGCYDHCRCHVPRYTERGPRGRLGESSWIGVLRLGGTRFGPDLGHSG